MEGARHPAQRLRIHRLLESDVDADPIAQFRRWFDEARAGDALEPDAMAFASSGRAGEVSARMVLLRGLDERGFTFYTNYESLKGRDIDVNPRGALLFFWPHLSRQVRVEGTVERLAASESDEYFARRPRGHQIAAWASEQSRPLRSRDDLERRVHEAERRFAGVDVPRPAYWGGYRLSPQRLEFWQGGPDRMHDRLVYSRAKGAWIVERLAP